MQHVSTGMTTQKPSCIALIPARAGSKRVPDKNVRMLGSHPLMAYSIATAQESGLFDAVVVSTDDARYAAIAQYYGADVPFLRPAELATATSPDIEWVRFTLLQLAQAGRTFDCFSILRPTSPFRTANAICRAWQTFLADSGADSLRAVEKCGQHPGKMWVMDNGRMRPFISGNINGVPWHSCQMAALPEVYVQNASLEIAWTRIAMEGGSIAGTNIVPFISQGMEGFDINVPEDWIVAEHLLAQGQAALPLISTAPFQVGTDACDR